MANAEAALNPNDAQNGWEGMQYPPDSSESSSEQERTHESIIARIGRIITQKASEMVNNFREKRAARREAILEAERKYDEQYAEQERAMQLYCGIQYLSTKNPQTRKEYEREIPEEDFPRLKFVEENLDIFQDCPSMGRNLSLREAFELCDDYAEHVSTLEDEQIPKSKYSTLIEMEWMLEQKIEEAKQSGDEQALEDYQRKYNMIQDLESMATIAFDYENIGDVDYFGSKLMMRRYIRERIENEGYCGNKEMRERKPPYVGGALGVEATLGVIYAIDGYEPLSEIYENINFDSEGDIDWDAVERFSPRGRELRTYHEGLRAADAKKRERDRCGADARKLRAAAAELRSDAEIQDLSQEVQEAIEAEKIAQLNGKYNEYFNANLKKIEALRSDEELDPDLESELNSKGLTREGYAQVLENKNKKIQETIANFSKGVFTEKQRAIIDAYQISRADLADRFEGRADRYMEYGKTLHQDFKQYERMYTGSNSDFVHDVLRAGLEEAPELPEEVAGYLCQNYKFDSSANGVGLRFDSLSQKRLQLEYIVADINGRVAWLKDTAKFCDSEFGDAEGVDQEDRVYLNPAVREMSGPLEAAQDTSESYPAEVYLQESEFLTEQVIPSIEAVMKAIDDRIAAANEQSASEQSPAA